MAYQLSSKQESSKIPVPFRLRLSDAGKTVKDTRDQSEVSIKRFPEIFIHMDGWRARWIINQFLFLMDLF